MVLRWEKEYQSPISSLSFVLQIHLLSGVEPRYDVVKNVAYQTSSGIDFLCLHFLLRCQFADRSLRHFQSETEMGRRDGKRGRAGKGEVELSRNLTASERNGQWLLF